MAEEKTILQSHGPDFQRAVIRLMMTDASFCAKAVHYLQEGFFSGELKWFFRKIKDHWRDYEKPMLDGDLATEVYKHGDNQNAYEKERIEIIAVTGKVEEKKIRKELTGFIRNNLFIGTYQQAANIYNSGSKEDAYQFTKDKVNDLVQIDFEETRVSSFGRFEEMCDKASSQKQEAIPTGIFHIDEAMGGGLMPQTWTTFLGGSNVGKSMLCPNLAYHAAEKGKKTFVTVHEDEEVPTYLRYLARFSGVSYNLLTQPRQYWPEDIAKWVKEADAKLREFVKIRYMYGSECFVENVLDASKMMLDEWEYHLFLNDYGQCLKSRDYRSGKEDKYSLQGYIYQELKQFCLEFDRAGAGGAQVNRLGHRINKKGGDLLRCTDVGDSWEIVKKSSNVITMNRSDADVEANRIVYLLDKVRNGRCPVAAECITDYKRMITHMPYVAGEKSQQEIPVETGSGER